MTALDELQGDARAFVGWFAGLLGLGSDEVLANLLQPVEGPVRTEVEDGQFTGVDLRWVGRALRWDLGEGPEIELPTAYLSACRGLDCSGLGLDHLPVEPMPRLQILECGDNRLSQLELATCPDLVHVGCAGNRLMLLDLRRNSRLLRLDCTGNQITALVLPGEVALGWLKCGRNQLLTLDLRSLDALVEVVCSRNVLRRLVVGAHPKLELLDCSDNELAEIEFAESLPALRELVCGNNSLAQLPAMKFPALRLLDAHRNYIDRLDLRTNAALESLDVRKNQLQELGLANSDLRSLDCGSNRLASLGLAGCPALVELRCPRNELDALPLELVPRLGGLWCEENRIPALDLEPVPELTVLSAAANPIHRLDVRPVPDLAQLEVAAGTEVICTEVQRDRLLSPPLSRPRPDATPGQLHNLVRTYRGPNAERFFLEIVTLPQCDRGTALLAYWTSNPRQYAQYASREELSPWELDGWDLLTAIEDRVRKGGFPTNNFRFYPRDDRQTRSVRGRDWVGSRAQVAVVREIPPELMEPGVEAERSTRAPA